MSEEQKNNVPLIGEIFVEGEAPPQYYQAFLNAQEKAEDAATDAQTAATDARTAATDARTAATGAQTASADAQTAATDAQTAADAAEQSEQNAKADADRAEGAAGLAEDAKKRAEEVADSVGSPVSYNVQTLSKREQAQAKENIGASTFYHTTREEVKKAHTDTDWAKYIYELYRELPGVVENEVKSDDGTFTNYEYVISTGEYSTEGSITIAGGKDLETKKPKYLILTGWHGCERHAVISAYRFIRDVLNGHNVPQSFKEGVILQVMPVANPAGFNEFSYTAPDTNAQQAIDKWLNENVDADLAINVHNGSALNEVVAILGDPNKDAVAIAKKIAMKGIDRIIPFWRDVIGYHSEAEVITSCVRDDVTGKYTEVELEKKSVIFSYCVGRQTEYFNPSIPNLSLEIADYYGDYSDFNPTYDEDAKTATIPCPAEYYPTDTPETKEAIAAGAEVIGNILLEFYKQSLASEVIDDMKVMDRKLDTLLKRTSFRIESGTLTLAEDVYWDTPTAYKIDCSSGAKLFVFYADDATYKNILKATTKRSYTAAIFGNAFEDNIKTATLGSEDGQEVLNCKNKRSYASQLTDLSYMGEIYTGYWQMMDTATNVDNTDGIKFMTPALKAGTYHWTAYYWDE